MTPSPQDPNSPVQAPSGGSMFGRREVAVIMGVLVVVALAVSAWWWTARSGSQAAFVAGSRSVEAQGLKLVCDGGPLEPQAGYPVRSEIACDQLDLIWDDGLRVSGAGFRGVAMIWDLNHWILEWDGPIAAYDGERALGSLSNESLRGSVRLQSDGSVPSISVIGVAPALLDPQGNVQARGTQAELHMRPTPASDAVQAAAANEGEALALRPGFADVYASVQGLTNGAGEPLLPEQGITAPVDVLARASIESAWEARATTLDAVLAGLASRSASFETLQLRAVMAEARVGVDASGQLQPDGTLSADGEVSYRGAAVDAAIDALPAAGVFQLALRMMRDTELDGEPARGFPLSVRNGQLRVMGLPVAPVPPVPTFQQ